MTTRGPKDVPQDDGTVPARFRVLEVLSSVGATSGSTLHRGVLGDGTRVLVKRADGNTDPRVALGRLRRERELLELLGRAEVGPRPLALLAHPVAPALVLEDRPGALLQAVLAARRLEPAECLEIGIDLAAALGELHAVRVVHRDLRLANVLVGRAEGATRTGAYLVDLSRAVHEGAPLLAEAGDDLAFLSPERTGRIGREVDGRSDLYSLGVLLYRLLTGELPFTATDLLGWVHCHVARQPRPPADVAPVPRSVSDVVMKLLAKLPDDRYQSAAGVRQDLEQCLRDGRAGADRPFTLGVRDFSGRFRLPGRLYGREPELEALLRAHRSAETGATALVLVAGPSGIGKTSLVEELRRKLAEARVHFSCGKFDRDRRGSPHATLGAALGGLVQQVLSSSEEEVARWRDRLLEALGNQGRLVAEVVPQLGLLLGPQPPVPDLPPRDAQGRFARVWQRFLSALAGPEHPLVLFLDDLQWADPETLSLLEYAAGDPGTHHLLLVGACRDEGLDEGHPLSRMLAALGKAGVPVETVRPGPFSLEDAARLIGDAMSCDRARGEPLARLVHERTAGNPFFFLQLLSTLVEEGLIAFRRADGEWTWELERLQARQGREGAAALLAEKLQQLPEATRRVLRLAGSLGNGAHLDTLALVDGRAREETERELSEAVVRGLVRLNGDGTFTFAHDRVQEAAGDLVPEEERPRVHLAIGRVLLAQGKAEDLGDRVFAIVSHLQRAASLLGPEERIRLSELQLEAGRKAAAATAYASAARHLAEGQESLPPDAWASRYPLAYALALERARCEWLAGDHAAAEEWIAVLLREARSRAERAEAYRVRLDLLTTRNDVAGCVQTALEACGKLYGLEFPLHPTPPVLVAALTAALEAFGDRPIEAQLEAPELIDPDRRALAALASSAAPTAFFLDPMLHNLMMCEVAGLSIRHGNCPHSSHALASFALSVGAFLGRWDEAFRLGKVACALADRYRTSSVGCYFVAGLIERQVHPPADAIEAFQTAWRRAVDGGDVNHGCQAGFVLVQTRLAAGEPLADVAEEATRQLEFARSARYLSIQDTILPTVRLVESLRGGTERLGSFEGPGFDQAAYEARLTPQFPYMPEAYHGYRACAELLAGDFAAALDTAVRGRPFAQDGPIATNEYHRYVMGLAACGRHDQVPEAERGPLLALAVECLEWVRARAVRNPRTFAASSSLLAAEIARLEGHDRQAMEGYDEAIAAARREGFVHLEGMAAEAAARFYRQRGSSVAATAHLRVACDAYRRWGATAKVKALAAEHPELASERADAGRGDGAGVRQLDLLAAAARASQAISGEMSPERLLETLLGTVVEAAGAQFGSLLLDGAPDVALAAQATVQGAGIDVKVATGSSAGAGDLPASILSYTRRTHEPVVLWDAAAPNPYSADPGLRRRGARSVMCLPILRRGALRGLLYLENDLVPSAFSPERLPLLEVLAAQAAISLELSRHREQLEQLVAQRTGELTRANESLKAANRKLEQAHRQLLQSEKMASLGRLAAGVAHEINNPVAYVTANLEALADYVRELLQGVAGAPGDGRLEELRSELTSVIGDTRFGLERVTTIVRALRAFSHPSESAWQVTDLRRGLESALHLLRNDLERKAVVVVEHGELPPVECLPPELNQVFMNLLLNAVQAIPERGTITIRSGTAEDEVWIEVSDTGEGIPPENLSRIYDPFFTTKPVGEGTGLGLSLAYGIIEKHHGRIDVTSEPGRGATFRIWLPVRQPAAGQT